VKVVVAPNSFKGSLTAAQAASAIARGVLQALPDAEVVEVPVADGGDGTVEALVSARKGTFRDVEVEGPLGDPIRAVYGLIDGGRTGVVELAATSGLALIPVEKRDPRRGSPPSLPGSAARRPTTAGPGWPRPSAIACSTQRAATCLVAEPLSPSSLGSSPRGSMPAGER